MIIVDKNGQQIDICQSYCYQVYDRCLIVCPKPTSEDEYYAEWPFDIPKVDNNMIVLDLSTEKKKIVNENCEEKEIRVFRDGTNQPPMVNFIMVFGDGSIVTKTVEPSYKEKGYNFLISNVLHECNCKNGVDNDKDGLKDCPDSNDVDWNTIDNDCYNVCNTNWEIGTISEPYYAYPIAEFTSMRDMLTVKYFQISVQYFTEIFCVDKNVHPLEITDFLFMKDGNNEGQYDISFKTSDPCISTIECEDAIITKGEPYVENIAHTFTANLNEEKSYVLKINLEIRVSEDVSLQKGIVKVVSVPKTISQVSPTPSGNLSEGNNQGIWIILILIMAAAFIIYRWWKQKGSKNKNKNRKSKNKNRNKQ